MHTNIVVSFNRLPFVVSKIAQVTLEQLYLAVNIFVFVQQFLIVYSCTSKTLIIAVYEFACAPLASCHLRFKHAQAKSVTLLKLNAESKKSFFSIF